MTDERSPGRDPVRANARRIVLGSVDFALEDGGRQKSSYLIDQPVRASARRIVLGSVCHLECLQTSQRRRKNIKWRLKKLGFEEKDIDNKI